MQAPQNAEVVRDAHDASVNAALTYLEAEAC